MKFKIPRCPECKKPITEIYETIYEKYFFNKKTGRYEEFNNGFGGTITIECSNCNADISDIFENGACNYQAKRIRR